MRDAQVAEYNTFADRLKMETGPTPVYAFQDHWGSKVIRETPVSFKNVSKDNSKFFQARRAK